MILRIYWTDRYQRQHAGLSGVHGGIRLRLAKRFGVSVEVIKKVVYARENHHGQPRRARFPSIAIKTIKRSIKTRIRQNPYGD